MKILFTAFVIALVALTNGANAGTLVIYEFTGNSPAPTTTMAGVSARDMANTASGMLLYDQQWYGSSGSTSTYMTHTNTEANLTQYFMFILNPTSPTDQITYESFNFYQNREVLQTRYSVSYRIGGGAEVFIATRVNAALQSINPTAPGNMTYVSIDFADFTTSSAVEWRIYGSDTSDYNRDKAFRIDDVAVMGSVVAIPEPSTVALLMGGAAIALAVLRRKNS